MPKSKRNKIVHLTQVKKKGKDHKDELMKQIEQYVAQYSKVYIFNFDSTKSDRIMLLRLRLKGCGRIFAGRNAVVIAGFKAISTRTGTNFDDLIHQITGHRGLLFTDSAVGTIIDLVDKEVPEFREKLLGYASIAPDTKVMDVDEDSTSRKDGDNNSDDDDDDNDVDDEDEVASNRKSNKIKKKSSTKRKQKLKKRTKKGVENERHEVKFVKI